MKTKRLLVILLAAWLAAGTAEAQQAATRPAYPAPSPTQSQGTPAHEIPPEAYSGDMSGLSDWIVYRRDCCEGKHGRLTPLYTEVYLRAGPSIPIGGQTLSRELQTGWSITGGVRALFFNEPMTKAWTVDLHNRRHRVSDHDLPRQHARRLRCWRRSGRHRAAVQPHPRRPRRRA
jgi:hypothetical protein